MKLLDIFNAEKRRIFFNQNFFVLFGSDIFLLCLSWLSAYLIRFEFDIPDNFTDEMIALLPAIIVIKLVCFYLFDLYRGMWRFTSVSDLLNIIKAVSLSALLIVLWVVVVYRYKNVPRSVVFIDFCLNILLISGIRLAIRLFFQKYVPTHPIQSLINLKEAPGNTRKMPKKRLLIIGAGNCGEKILREINDNPQLRYSVVGFLDDNAAKIGRRIHGVPVRGIISDLGFIAEKTGTDELLIAIPSASSTEMRRIVSLCKQSGIRYRTLPGYSELIGGRVSMKAVREVSYRDLIGRETVKLDEKLIANCLHGQEVLVTGAGGSIGSELCRQICRFEPKRILLLERAESPLYEIDLELRRDYGSLDIVPILGDICEMDHLRNAFRTYKPNSVFHAAAYKHVPMLEIQPWKALENNIMGTLNLVTACVEFGADRFVLVSTDKAVRPANVMGASKRVAEMISLNHNRCGISQTKFMAVRFGNVVGSVGSVVPLFQKQIAAGGPVTVTHPDVTRYFMTIREASQLILQAGAMGEGGEIFILDMGTPVKIVDMARDLIRLSGLEPDVDIKIAYIGLRPGEKLYEELITADENAQPTPHPKIFMLKGSPCDIELLNAKIHELESLIPSQDSVQIRSKLKDVVPDYCPIESNSSHRQVA